MSKKQEQEQEQEQKQKPEAAPEAGTRSPWQTARGGIVPILPAETARGAS